LLFGFQPHADLAGRGWRKDLLRGGSMKCEETAD